MQKINILGIVASHYRTLKSDQGTINWSDLGVFFLIPIIVATALYSGCWTLSKDAIGQSISVFAIFAALLLSVQVALYSVSLRPLEKPDDPKKQKAYIERTKYRTALIRELNDNIAYLILLSVFSVTAFLIAYVMLWVGTIPSAIITALYIHFFLTILMVIKRASIVFSREYESGSE